MTLSEPLLEVLELVEDRIVDKNLRLSLGKRLEQHMVLADRGFLRDIFQALLENGVQHSGGSCALAVEASEEAGRVWVSVSDGGKGVDPAAVAPADDIFTGKRSGLGLATVRKLLEAHGSRLEVETARGEGFTARFSLQAIPK